MRPAREQPQATGLHVRATGLDLSFLDSSLPTHVQLKASTRLWGRLDSLVALARGHDRSRVSCSRRYMRWFAGEANKLRIRIEREDS